MASKQAKAAAVACAGLGCGAYRLRVRYIPRTLGQVPTERNKENMFVVLSITFCLTFKCGPDFDGLMFLGWTYGECGIRVWLSDIGTPAGAFVLWTEECKSFSAAPFMEGPLWMVEGNFLGTLKCSQRCCFGWYLEGNQE